MADGVVVALFRHGITEDNKKQRYIGWTNSPICQEAEETLLSCAYEKSPYEQIFTSDLQRCLQTAQSLFPNETYQMMSEFREMHFGDWEGKSYNELADDTAYNEWVRTHCGTPIPNGESYEEFAERIEAGLCHVVDKVVENDLSSVGIVTHGGVIRYLLEKLADQELPFWEWKVPHGNGFELVWESKDSFRRGERCTLLREVLLTGKPLG